MLYGQFYFADCGTKKTGSKGCLPYNSLFLAVFSQATQIKIIFLCWLKKCYWNPISMFIAQIEGNNQESNQKARNPHDIFHKCFGFLLLSIGCRNVLWLLHLKRSFSSQFPAIFCHFPCFPSIQSTPFVKRINQFNSSQFQSIYSPLHPLWRARNGGQNEG